MCMSSTRAAQAFLERRVYCTLKHCADKYDSSCAIYGKTDAAIAETASWFWSLKHSVTDAQVWRIICAVKDTSLTLPPYIRSILLRYWTRIRRGISAYKQEPGVRGNPSFWQPDHMLCICCFTMTHVAQEIFASTTREPHFWVRFRADNFPLGRLT